MNDDDGNDDDDDDDDGGGGNADDILVLTINLSYLLDVAKQLRDQQLILKGISIILCVFE